MKYPHLMKGIKKLYIAQIFAAIAAVVFSGASFMVSVQLGNLFSEGAIFDSFMFLAALIVAFGALCATLVASVIGFVGYIQAAKDEELMKKAMFCLIAYTVLMLVSSFFRIPNNTLSNIISASATIVEMFVMVFAMSGLIHVAEQLECADVANRGNTVLKLLAVTFFISAVDALIIRTFELTRHAQIASVIIGVVDLIVNVLQYILFLGYLRKCRIMLAEEQ